MIAILLLACAVVGLAIHFVIVRPFLIPLTQKIPTGRAYRPTFGVRST